MQIVPKTVEHWLEGKKEKSLSQKINQPKVKDNIDLKFKLETQAKYGISYFCSEIFNQFYNSWQSLIFINFFNLSKFISFH